MKSLVGYSGINSQSFLEGFNPTTREFVKSRLPQMRFPNKIYFNTPQVVLELGDTTLLSDYCTGHIATKRAKYHGGIPIVFSADLGNLPLHFDFTAGRTKEANRVLNFHTVRVGNIYRVELFVKNLCTVLTRLTKEEETDLASQ